MNTGRAIIIGAGPAGLMCAVHCAKLGVQVLVLEKNASAGKKLLITGSGRCNVTHSGAIAGFLDHYGGKGRFVKPALFNFTNENLRQFFIERNLRLVDEGDGKLFPVTNRSSDILKVLLDECVKTNVAIEYNAPVTAVIRTDKGFAVFCSEKKYQSAHIVIAVGGKSYPLTGSCGDGYEFAESLGHTITEVAPALVQIIVKDFSCRSCAGISLPDSLLALFRGAEKITAVKGDVLITHAGLSGPGILDLSRYVRPGDVIKIDLTRGRNRDVFQKELVSEFAKDGKRPVKKCLSLCKIPDRLVSLILSMCKVAPELNAGSIDKKTRMLLADALTGLPFVVQRTGDFSDAMVTRGGVSLNEIDPKTMESRIIKGLYFAGEVMDIDGDTGGYNLQFAFSSGVLAAKSIAK